MTTRPPACVAQVVARDLRLSDFLGALRTTGRSVSPEMLQRYEEFSRGRGGRQLPE